MKRSEINAALKEMEQMIREYRFAIPPFCNFTPEEWKEKGHDYDEIRDNMLGWDITDYGLGDFDKVGFSLITIRNGNLKMKDKYTKSYAEKLLYIKEGQYSPMHFHWSKMEDIINRGGGNVLIRVYNSTKDEDLDKVNDVHVHVDGREMVVPAGTQVRLTPGESISIYPYMYHDFEVRLKDMEHGKRFLEQSLLFGIIAQLYDIYYTETQIAPTDSLHMSTLTTLVRYIDEHIAEDLSLKQLSEVTNFSTYHLCRIFKKNTGTTLNKYIVSKRIENAKLLLAGDASIQTISKEVGFNNYNHFYRCFRQIVGINPADYREILLTQGDEALIQLQATGVIKRPADTDVLNEEDEDFGDENLDDEP